MLFITFSATAQRTDWQKENLKGKIISVKETEYEATTKFGEDEKEKLIKTTQTFYNEKGNIRKEVDKEGNITYYAYDKSNRLIRKIQIKPTPHISDKVTYDTISRKEYIYAPHGKLFETNSYKYSKDSKKMELSEKEKYSYSPAKDEIKSYNSKGELSTKTVITNNGRTRTDGFSVTEYNAAMQPVKITSYLGANNGKAAAVKTFQYDMYGNIIQSKSEVKINIGFRNEQHSIVVRYKYAYDKFKNWIIQKEYKNGEIEKWKERTYVYANATNDFIKAEQDENQRKREEEERCIKKWQYTNDSIQRLREMEIARKRTQDSIQNIRNLAEQEKDTIMALVREILNQNIFIYSLGNYSHYKINGIHGKITNAKQDQQAITFILKNKTEFPPITFTNTGTIEERVYREKCVVYFTEDKMYILALLRNSDYACKTGFLISRHNGNIQIYALSNKVLSRFSY